MFSDLQKARDEVMEDYSVQRLGFIIYLAVNSNSRLRK